MMVKALLLTNWDSDATYFVRLMPLFYIDNPRIKIERKPYQGQIAYSFFDSYTHLIMERPSGHNDLQVIKLAKQRGLKILLDYDDDVLHVFHHNPMHQTYESAKSTILECISEADEVWVSTNGVKKSFSLLNKNIHVIPNSHDNILHPVKEKKPFNRVEKKVIWRGGGSHEADIYEKGEFIVELVNSNPEWMFYFVGDRFIWLEQRCGNNYQPVSQMPLLQYFEFIHKLNCPIQFHPLSDTIFNRSKSNLAWLEGSFAGSAFFGNTNLPEFKHDSIYTFENLPKLNELPLEEKNTEAWEYIQENLLLSDINKIREERLLAL